MSDQHQIDTLSKWPPVLSSTSALDKAIITTSHVGPSKRVRASNSAVDHSNLDSVETAIVRAYEHVEAKLRVIEVISAEQLLLENPHELSLSVILNSLQCAFKRLKTLDIALNPVMDIPYYDDYPHSHDENDFTKGDFDTQVIEDSDDSYD